MDDYQTDDVIVFAGFIDDDYLRSNIYLYRYAIGLTENVAFWEDANGLDMGRRNFLMDFYGIDAGSIDSKEYMEMIKSDEFKEMGVYPDNNSIKKISNMIVVKLSDTPPEY